MVVLVALVKRRTVSTFLHVVNRDEGMLTSSDLLGHIASHARHQPLASIVRRQATGQMARCGLQVQRLACMFLAPERGRLTPDAHAGT